MHFSAFTVSNAFSLLLVRVRYFIAIQPELFVFLDQNPTILGRYCGEQFVIRFPPSKVKKSLRLDLILVTTEQYSQNLKFGSFGASFVQSTHCCCLVAKQFRKQLKLAIRCELNKRNENSITYTLGRRLPVLILAPAA